MCIRDSYYTIISVYNMIVALLATVLFLGTLAKEMNPKVKRQKLAITILALVPSWFAILTTIPVQLFGVADAEKAWQGNLLVILALVGLYVYLAVSYTHLDVYKRQAMIRAGQVIGMDSTGIRKPRP